MTPLRRPLNCYRHPLVRLEPAPSLRYSKVTLRCPLCVATARELVGRAKATAKKALYGPALFDALD